MSTPRLWVSIAVALCAACSSAGFVAAAQAGLPDERAYELVTPQENYGSEVYQPILGLNFAEYSGGQTDLHFQAAADGDRVAFVGGPTIGGNESQGYRKGNEYLGTRLPNGEWRQTNLSPEDPGVSLTSVYAEEMVYEDFSSDLSVGFLESLVPLASTAPGYGEPLPEFGGLYDVLYSTRTEGGGGYTPLFTTKPPYRSYREFKTAGGVRSPEVDLGHHLAFAGASSDLTHALFEANDALTGASEGRPAAEGGASPSFSEENNLYEDAGGQLRLVNVLPDGTTHANAVFGSGRIFHHVISEDGSRIFWTDLATGHIYVRENGTSTVEISSAGEYQTASSNGSVVFYTNGDLYEYELAGAKTVDLTPGVPVENVVGASEDGKYVYFMTTGHELELWHDGATTTIAAHPAVSFTAEVAPGGRSIVYTERESSFAANIYVFSVDTGSVYCLGCTAGGTRGTLPDTSSWGDYQTRSISDDGSRVFFDSLAALVPQDTNGRLDVYEWERPGAGGCTEVEGCIYLLSEGTSLDNSYLADASVSGNDVFIVTRTQLVGADQNDLSDLYDVRVDGGPPPSPPACTGTGCQGVPSAPPIFATPSSVTFAGVGNFSSTETVAKAKFKPKEKAKPKKQTKKKKKKKSRKRSVSKSKKANKSARKSARKRSVAKGGRS